MSIVRPKILPLVTIPTGGYDINFKISVAASLDTSLTATITAGDYFMAWDGYTDDLVYEIAGAIQLAITTAGHGTGRRCHCYIDSDHKLNIRFYGSAYVSSVGWENDVEITWATSDTGIVEICGSDGTTWSSTNTDHPYWTGDYQHGYAWYASEDHVLSDLMPYDSEIARIAQTTALDGTTKTVLWGSRYVNNLSLQNVKHVDMWSNGSAYGESVSYGLERNRGLECWWRLARQGTRFRLYRNDSVLVDAAGAVAAGVNSTTDTDSLRYTSGNWTDDEWIGMAALWYRGASTVTGMPGRFRIDDNDNEYILAESSLPGGGTVDESASQQFFIKDLRFQTYILNTEEMSQFNPIEVPNIDRYDIEIPLKRYVP